jgi:hypothetical protein
LDEADWCRGVEYVELTGNASLRLQWVTPAGGAAVVVPGSALHPDYGLATSSTTDDSSGVGAVTALTMSADYGSSIRSRVVSQTGTTTLQTRLIDLT